MSKFVEYLAVIGCFQGCLLFVMLVADTRMTTASRILGFQCLVMASVFLMPYMLNAADTTPVAYLAGCLFYLPAAAGGLAFLYCRSALTGRRIARGDIVHAIPLMICLALGASVFLVNPQEMVRWAQGTPSSYLALGLSEILLFAQAFGYACVTSLMIWRYRRQARDNLSTFNPAIFKWLLSLQIFTIVIWVLNALPSLTSAPGALAIVANLLMVVLIYAIALMQWRNPQLFAIPRLTALLGDDARGELDPDVRAEVFKAVKARVESDRLYLDNNLTLSDLAALTGTSKHHLSEALNRHANKNFYEFINQYRVDHVCERLIADPATKVLDIAFDAGFSSKSAFNGIFKQFTGQTPTAFRKNASS